MTAVAANVAIGCILANFLWQLMRGRQWAKASERSWFQLAAIVLFVLTAHLQGLA